MHHSAQGTFLKLKQPSYTQLLDKNNYPKINYKGFSKKVLQKFCGGEDLSPHSGASSNSFLECILGDSGFAEIVGLSRLMSKLHLWPGQAVTVTAYGEWTSKWGFCLHLLLSFSCFSNVLFLIKKAVKYRIKHNTKVIGMDVVTIHIHLLIEMLLKKWWFVSVWFTLQTFECFRFRINSETPKIL